MALIVISFAILTRYLRIGGTWKLPILAILLAIARLVYSGAAIAIVAAVITLGVHTVVVVRNHNEQTCKMSCRKELAGLALVLLVPILAGRLTSAVFTSRSGIEDVGGIPATAYILMGITSDGDKTACGPGSYDATNVYIYEISGRDHSAANREALSRINYAARDYLRGRRDLNFFLEKVRNEWTDPWFSSAVMTVYLWSNELEISEEFRAFLTGPVVQGIESFLSAFNVGTYLLASAAVACILYGLGKRKRMPLGRICRNQDQIEHEQLNCNGATVGREPEWLYADVTRLLLPLYFLGGFVFYLFWEAKARYCFSYFVCLIPLAAYGAERVVSWLSAIRETRV